MTIAAGTCLGRYEIRSQLGAGGMGEVYLVWDTRLERKVALKVLPVDVASEQGRMRRFVQEAKAASALSHPNIAHVYEIGEAEGISFIAIEYVEGQALSARIGGRPLDLDEIVDICIQIADALEEAHTKGITHRDIKPSNIILSTRNRVKVLDFGLAKIARPAEQALASDIATQLKTNPGMVLGTVQYMSPEQALGREIDHRTDIFSLGVVIYEMATGRLPFCGATATEIVDRIIHAQPEAIGRFNYNAPAELQRIVRKSLEKDRERRYQSMRELLVDLKNLKRDSNAGPTTAPKARRVRSRKAIHSLAILPFVNTSADPTTEYLSDGITESIINSLSQLPKLRVMARSTVFRYRGREVNSQEVGRELDVGAVLAGRVLHVSGRLIIGVELIDVIDGSQLWGEQYQRNVSAILDVQEEISRELSEKLRLKLTGNDRKRLVRRHTENIQAYHLYLKGRYYWNRRNEEDLLKGLDCFQEAIKIDPNYALGYAGLADCYITLSGLGFLPSNEGYPKARTAALKALEIDGMLAEAHTSLARIRSSFDWEWLAAERAFKEAIKLNPNYATAHHWYGVHLVMMERFEEGMREIRRASEIDPLSLIISATLSAALFFARKYDQAIESLQTTLEMDPNFSIAHIRLGACYQHKGMHEEALAEYQKATELLGSGRHRLEISAELALLYAASGDRGKAQDILHELEKQAKQSYAAPYDIARIYAYLGEKDQAFEWLEKAYESRSGDLRFLKVSHEMDSLRSDTRFTNLLGRVGL